MCSLSLNRWRLYLGCLFALTCTFCLADSPRTLRFEHLSVEQGMAQETVTAITQDQQGYMWFGSQNGLSRFDGYRVTVYKNIPSDPRSLADNWVQALHVDEKNRLWIGTRAGLQRFDPDSEKFTRFLPDESTTSGNGKRQVQAIIGGEQDELWLATNDGLQHFDSKSGRFDIFRHDDADAGSLNNDHVTALARDKYGNLWVGMKGGVDRLAVSTNHFEHFRLDYGVGPDDLQREVQSLMIDHEQSLWVVTTLGVETWRFEEGVLQKRHYGAADGLRPGMITALYQDRDANVWLGTNTNGLHRWDVAVRRFVSYPIDPRSVGGKEVSALYQDHTGTLWVGTWTGGVKYVDLASGGFSRFFHVPDDEKTLSDDRIYGIASDGKNHLWLAAFGGLNRLDLTTGESSVFRSDAKHVTSLSNDEPILAVFRDRHAQLWVGTDEGLGRFDPATGRFTPRLFRTGDPNSESITHIADDRSGTLWVASRGGLHRFDTVANTVRTYRHDAADAASLGDNWVKMTLQDRRGVFWIATDDGLDRLDPVTGRFSHLRHDSSDVTSLSSDRVQYLFEDRNGAVWVGTNGGLNRMETMADGAIRFHAYTTKEGLGDDSIGGILEDDEGHLWLSSTTGISRFDPATGKFRNYTANDGMIEGHYFVGSAFRDRDGTMYFGGVNGLTSFRPEAIRDNAYPPPVVITDIQISGVSISGKDSADGVDFGGAIQGSNVLNLSYRQRVFSIAFAALHYADPQRNRFAYQLQGFDKTWVFADSSKRVATYTNLDPGNYVFRVKAANKDGVWNESGATLAITITPPFWKTWWFRVLMTMLFFGSAWLVYRARVRVLTDQKKLLEEQVRARTSEVVQQKELVEQKNELLQTAKEQLQRYLEDRERLFISISHDLRTPITRLKLRSELLDDDDVRNEFHEDLDELDMMVKGALQCVKDTDIHENPTEVRLDTLINRMIRGAQLAGHYVSYKESGLSVVAKPLALKRAIGNLLDNALHYGEQVEIAVHAVGGWIEIQIRDHGPGVDENVLGSIFQSHVRLDHGRSRNEGGLGLGLGIARGIVQEHGGEVVLKNHPDNGLVATIRLLIIAGEEPSRVLDHTALCTQCD